MRLLPKTIEEMQDILEVKDLLKWDLTWLYLIGLLLVGLLLFFLLKKLVKYLKKSRPILMPPQSPMDRALIALDQLVAKRLLEKNQIRPFYFEFSEIFRRFLEEEWKIPAVEATERELKAQLATLPFGKEKENQLNFIIQVSEMAKFAKYFPSKDEILNSVKHLRMILQTAVRPPENVVGSKAA
ncbi:MAG: hypothetical protein HYU97_08000 [Deltaproteobacteria bacterium]|nr:hypothetical protein [Deltaproteobacteria bacterium]